jgi:hypothetical protein
MEERQDGHPDGVNCFHPDAPVGSGGLVELLNAGGQGGMQMACEVTLPATLPRSPGRPIALPATRWSHSLPQFGEESWVGHLLAGGAVGLVGDPACGECVDTGSMPSVLVTAASWDRA